MSPLTRYLIPACLISIMGSLTAFAEDIFEPPVRLKADGKVIDTGAPYGHCGPCFEDLDGDGLQDLLVGNFDGNFEIYRNVGTAGKPQFKQNGFLEAGGVRAEVPIYCCVAAQPRFCDLDGDGIRDMISSSYDPGSCYFFRGLAGHRFAAREELLDRSGVPVRACPMTEYFGSFFTPVDWDADGDLDLLIGCFDGMLNLRLNEGDAKQYQFATENQTVTIIGGKPLCVWGHFCPAVADWNGDGMWDILAGSVDGSVTWFRNSGTKGKPLFESGKVLVPPHIASEYSRVATGNEEGDESRGRRVQIDVTDFNHDGKLDLVAGDYGVTYDLKPGLTDKQIQHAKELHADYMKKERAYRPKFEAVVARYTELYPGDAAYTKEASTYWSKQVEEIHQWPEWKQLEEADARFGKEMRQYIAKPHGDDNNRYNFQTPHGYVWLYLRK